ncbi:MAG: DUF2007 domain-containing protein [Deltaproteobacteria bacterium]|nr:DUF2007 domain-containing protein [Deltaproteobacteria bacterium]NND27018.1 hypothetical protein [Myxococcales bacterium]MBT8464561.1 DUF2007 domain-containing protein [Deltaproteobacteria bacterium]MBT8483117.1 DUF2007 domain-containing protein [Deltaproteobacteria bacterium]NNK05822.1 hypothetical protein [Myxococcales bacterium]
METRSVYETDDEVQALALQEALEADGIAAVLVNHRDTAYPGITDRQRHGTEIRVETDQVAQATQLIEEFLAAQPVEGPPIAPPPDSRPAPGVRGPSSLIITLSLLALLGVVAYLLTGN